MRVFNRAEIRGIHLLERFDSFFSSVEPGGLIEINSLRPMSQIVNHVAIAAGKRLPDIPRYKIILARI